MRLPSKKIEKKLMKQGYDSIIAVDEVGMGCLAGPVVVCAVRFTKDFFNKEHKEFSGVRDSKLLSANQRGEYAALLQSLPGIRYQLAFCYPKTIDRLNIYRASRLAMRRAVGKLEQEARSKKQVSSFKALNSRFLLHASKIMVLVDGPHKIDNLSLPQQAIVKGDRRVFAIACASIIAKVHRDRMMLRYHKRFPQYGFDQHKGYGTKQHFAMLAAHGPTPLHRRSFAPIDQMI